MFWSTWTLKCVRWSWSHLKMHTEIFRKPCQISTFEKLPYFKCPPSSPTPKKKKKTQTRKQKNQMLFWHRFIVLSSFFFFPWSYIGTFLLLHQLYCQIHIECFSTFLTLSITYPLAWVPCILPKDCERLHLYDGNYRSNSLWLKGAEAR